MTTAFLLLMWSCRPDTDPPQPVTTDDTATPSVTDADTDTDTDSDTDTDTDTDTDSVPTDTTALPDSCVEASNLPVDPITVVGSLSDKEANKFYELTDLVVRPDDNVVWAVGQGGLLTFGVGGSKPEFLAQAPEMPTRFVKIAALSGGHAAVTNWNAQFPTDFAIYDLSNPSNPQELDTLSIDLAAGLAWSEPYVYVGGLDGKLHVVDASDLDDVSIIRTVDGLNSPYEVQIVGDWAYIADAPLGLVPVDLSDPTNPVVGEPIAEAAGAWDLDTDGTHVYVAAGNAGIFIYDLVDPAVPALVSHIEDVGGVVGISVDGDVLTAVSHADLLAIDVTDRTQPVALGKQDHNQFGLAVEVVDERIYVGDWGFLSVWELDASVASPEADYQSSEVYFYDGDGAKTLELTNLGADDLEIFGATLGDERVTVGATLLVIPPGASSELVLTFDSGEAEPSMKTELCVSTNDPDQPLQRIDVATTSNDGISDLAVGQAAPDFSLQSIDGLTYRLSDQLGDPVILVYFATW